MLRHSGQCGLQHNKGEVFTSWYVLAKILMYIQFLWFPIGFQYEAASIYMFPPIKLQSAFEYIYEVFIF